MLGTAIAAIHTGFHAEIVRVEADVSSGFPRFQIVGLPDSAVKESKLRIRSGFRNSHLPFPQGRITMNLTPANFRKRGSGLDLAMAIAILRAEGHLPPCSGEFAFLAELQLSGALAPIDCAVSMSLRLSEANVKRLYVADDQVLPVELRSVIDAANHPSLMDVVASLLEQEPSQSHVPNSHRSQHITREQPPVMEEAIGIDSVYGREHEKRILAIAAAGRHPLLFIGPPGIGKTKLAQHLVDLLPDLDDKMALHAYARMEVADHHAAFSRRPVMRSPHHSLTTAGMVGGGSPPHPGEVTLAHDGVLLLDELFEFPRATLDALREPLLEHVVHLSRGGRSATLPANFLLIATANPCPCGLRGYGECRCLESDVRRYWARCSGPLLDRIDIVHYMGREIRENSSPPPRALRGDTGSLLRRQVVEARAVLKQVNARGDEDRFAPDVAVWFYEVKRKLNVSERIGQTLTSLAKTVAALDGRSQVTRADVAEALQLRHGASRAFMQ